MCEFICYNKKYNSKTHKEKKYNVKEQYIIHIRVYYIYMYTYICLTFGHRVLDWLSLLDKIIIWILDIVKYVLFLSIWINLFKKNYCYGFNTPIYTFTHIANIHAEQILHNDFSVGTVFLLTFALQWSFTKCI